VTQANGWLEANSQYVSAALAWLRLRIEWRCAIDSASTDPHPTRGRSRATSTPDTLADRVAEAAHDVAAIEAQMSAPPAIVSLAASLGLSEFERHVLFLCAAPEFDTAMSGLYARAQGNGGLLAPTFALALLVFDDPAWDALSPERPLRYWHLIEISQPGAQPLTTSALRTDERIANYIKGLNYLDDRLSPYLTSIERSRLAGDLPQSQRDVAERIALSWRAAGPGHVPVVQLIGSDRVSKQVIAAHAAAAIGRRLYTMNADAVPAQNADPELLARLWQRESALLPIALFIDAQDSDASVSAHPSVRRFFSRADGAIVFGAREQWPGLPRDTVTLETRKPTPEEQRSVWAATLGDGHDTTAALLASQFNLNVPDIRRIVETAATTAAGSSDVADEDSLWDACRAHVRPNLGALAHRIDTRARWDDIVLPREEMRLLRQLAAQVQQRSKVYSDWGFAGRMNRGLGITALFAGESGTGKTMAAEVIATALRLNLYRIDLSAVVSKYVGETEKNLCRLFDAAEDGGAILFFDEADALFGKRSEVKDSHDRYANIEINFLLQRMEAYSGLAILATNMRSALDVAFTRRLRFIVSFPFPSVADRRRMWQKAFPSQTPVTSLDYDRLARLNLTGGGIFNAAVNAAFLAAESGESVNMVFALAAARQELIKLDRPINEADFEWQSTSGAVA
jgi:hypothetical protein